MCWRFVINLDRCAGSFNTFHDSSNKACVPNETGSVNLHFLKNDNRCKLIKNINKLHIKFYGRKCNINQKWNNGNYWCKCKNPKEYRVCKRGCFWNSGTCSCGNDKYAGIICDSVVTFDKIIEETKSTSTKTIQIKSTSRKNKTVLVKCTYQNILRVFFLITIALLIGASIYLSKYQSKQKYLLPFHNTNKLKEIDIKNILWKFEIIINEKKLILKFVRVIILMT